MNLKPRKPIVIAPTVIFLGSMVSLLALGMFIRASFKKTFNEQKVLFQQEFIEELRKEQSSNPSVELSQEVSRFEDDEIRNLVWLLDPDLQNLVLATSGGEANLPFILDAAQRYGMDYNLMVSMAFVESSLNARAVNEKTEARGLFQIRPICHRDVVERMWGEEILDGGDNLLFNPQYNSMVGATYLAWCIEHTSTINEALAAYNWGLSNVKNVEKSQPPSVERYVDKILDPLRNRHGR